MWEETIAEYIFKNIFFFIMPRRQRMLLSSTICIIINMIEKFLMVKILSYTVLMNRYTRIQKVYLLQIPGKTTPSALAYSNQAKAY